MNANTETDLCNNDDDPGLMFRLAQSAQVHTCMAMPSLATVMPPLQQGKEKTLVAFCYFLHFCRNYSG